MQKFLVLACLVAILFAGKVQAQTGAPGFSIYRFNSASGVQISLQAAGGAVSTIKADSGHFLTGSPQGNVQLKPTAGGDSIQYVSAGGNDASDGLSWGTAKLSIAGALMALTGGSVSPPTAGTGTVYFSGGVPHPQVNCGLWLMGPSDPGYASPPACWLRVTNAAGNTINVVGVPNRNGSPNPHMGLAFYSKWPPGGIGVTGGLTTYWLSATTESINISNIGGAGGNRGVLIGQCSTGDRTGTCVCNNIMFTGTSHGVTSGASTGPTFDITGQSYWIWLKDVGVNGNAVLAAGGRFADNAAAVLIDGAANQGNGLINIKDVNLAGGGIKVNGTTDLIVDNVIEEGDFVHDMPPPLWFNGWSGTSAALVSHVEGADFGPTPTPCIQVDFTQNFPMTSGGPIILNAACGVLGPATILNTSVLNSQSNTSAASPLRQGQIGFFLNSIVGQTDVARRNDALVAARFLNKASSNTATWVSNDPTNSTITTGITDPFGGTGAAKIVHNIAGTASFLLGPAVPYTSTIGDWIIVGVWEMGMGGDGNLTPNYPGYGALTYSAGQQDNGMAYEDRWSFRWKAFKIGNAPGAQFIQADVQYSTGAVTLYGPVLYIIPNGTLSDNEVIDFATSMASTDIACPVGTICNVAGHPVQLTSLALGSGNQMTSVSGNSGRAAQSSGTMTVTKLKTADANGNIVDTAGSGTLGITFPSKLFITGALCNNATPAPAWNLPTSAAPTVSCRTGTNIQEGTLNFADADSAQFSLPLASDWTGAIDARLIFFSRDTRGTVIFQIATSCAATSGSTVDDIAFNTADVFTTITLNATANAQWETNKTSISITGCSPLDTLQVKISRAQDTASSRVSVKGLELTVRRAL
jgi:hypothetical protein